MKSANHHQLEGEHPISCGGVEGACKAYEAWAEAYLSAQHSLQKVRLVDGVYWLPSAAVENFRINVVEHSTRLTLHPMTKPSLDEIALQHSLWDAIGSDWFKVGSDLYEAIRKTKIDSSSVQSSEDQSECLPTR